MKMKWGLLVSALALSTMLVTACGGGNAEQASNQNESTPASATGTQVNIEASNWKFNQEVFEVNAGEEFTINFSSTEGYHGIGIQGLDVEIEKEGSKTLKVDEPGEYTIFCNILCGPDHGKMIAKLVVK